MTATIHLITLILAIAHIIVGICKKAPNIIFIVVDDLGNIETETQYIPLQYSIFILTFTHQRIR